MTVLGLTARNFKIFKAVQLKPTPTGVVTLRGENESGKTTILEIIMTALDGLKSAPQQPIKSGADDAEIIVDLGDIVIRRKWTDPNDRSKSSVVVKNAAGGEIGSSQAVLDSLTAKFADPVKFQHLSDLEQVREVLAMIDLPIDLKQSKADESALEKRRLLMGHDVKTLSGQVEELELTIGDADVVDVDISGLTKRLAFAVDVNAKHAELALKRGDCLEKHTEAVTALEVAQVAFRKAEVALDLANAEVEMRLSKGKESAANLAAVMSPVDTAPIQAQIETAEQNQAAAHAAGQLVTRRKELQTKQDDHSALDFEIKDLRRKREEVLSTVEFPVDDLGYDVDNNRLTFNGLPLSQASAAMSFDVSVRLAMAQGAMIKVLYGREGSLLDEKNKARLCELAEERGWQVWLELVDDNPEGGGIYIEDGVATGDMVVDDDGGEA